MIHRRGHHHDGYKTCIKQKKADRDRCDKYLALQALIATHEQAKNPDYVYIKQLEHRRDTLKNSLINSGII